MARPGLALLELRRNMGLRHVSTSANLWGLVERTLQTVYRKQINADSSEPTTMMHGVMAKRSPSIASGIKRIARMSGIPRSQLQGFVNLRVTPNAATIAKIEAALARLI
jgi:hypothetical protein